MQRRYKIEVYGAVQDVGLRYRVNKRANKLGIVGWIRNNSDGSVGLEVQSDDQILQEFIGWLRKSPGFSRIDELKLKEINTLNEIDFIVR